MARHSSSRAGDPELKVARLKSQRRTLASRSAVYPTDPSHHCPFSTKNMKSVRTACLGWQLVSYFFTCHPQEVISLTRPTGEWIDETILDLTHSTVMCHTQDRITPGCKPTPNQHFNAQTVKSLITVAYKKFRQDGCIGTRAVQGENSQML